MRPSKLIVPSLGLITVCLLSLLMMRVERGPELPLEDLLPADATLALHLDLRSVGQSPAWQRWVDRLGEDRGLSEVRALCGMDPLELVDEVAVAVWGGQASPLERVLFLARGDIQQLAACVKKVEGASGVVETTFEGFPALASASGPSRAVALGKHLVAAGDEASVRRAVTLYRDGAASIGQHSKLATGWSEMAKGHDLTGMFAPPERWHGAIAALGGEEAAALQRATFGLRVGADLGLSVVLQSADQAAAAALDEMLTGRVATAKREPLVWASAVGKLLRRLKHEAQGDVVVLTLACGVETAMDALGLLSARLPRSAFDFASGAKPNAGP